MVLNGEDEIEEKEEDEVEECEDWRRWDKTKHPVIEG